MPEDIFEKVDPATPSVPKAARPVLPLPVPRAANFTEHNATRRLPILIAVGAVLLLGGGVIAYLALRSPKAASPTAATSVTTQNTTNTPSPTITSAQPAEILTPSGPSDKDADGLADAREGELGTNPTKVDTDSDGLSDRDEVDVYTTDPQKPDSDGDGNLDGAEVKKGYNPKGAGVLLDLNVGKQKLQK